MKFASSHDLRRSHGTQWASVVGQGKLQDLVRHADYHTTAAYYVDQEAIDRARSVWHKAGVEKGTVLGFVPQSSPRSSGGVAEEAVDASDGITSGFGRR